jgi:hypothetical protein
MRLYHFTAKHHIDGGIGHAGPGIRLVGLLPNEHPLIALPGHVWLTEDGSWKQVWSSRPVPGSGCDRTEARLTLIIPKVFPDRLYTIDRVLPFVRADWREDFTDGLDLSAWRLYLGRIPWAWVRGVEHRDDVPVAA